MYLQEFYIRSNFGINFSQDTELDEYRQQAACWWRTVNGLKQLGESAPTLSWNWNPNMAVMLWHRVVW